MKNRKIAVLLALLLLVALLAGASVLYDRLRQTNQAPEQLAEETTENVVHAPDFTVFDLDGTEVHLSDYLGKPVVLNFWASWCGPCKQELPDFQTVYEEMGNEVQFLMVNMTDGMQETLDTASAFAAKTGYTLPIYYDTQFSAARAYGVSVLPCTYFIDARGYAVTYATGAIDAGTLKKGISMIFP